MLKRLMIGLALGALLCSSGRASAQSSDQPPALLKVDDPSSAAVGDHWTMEEKDEISGVVKEIRNAVVTDVSKGEIAVRFDVPATGRSGNLTYDRSWAVLSNDNWRYRPNDGLGMNLPLTQGSKWKFTSDAINTTTGAVWRRSGITTVTGQEHVATKAGEFDTFVVETTFSARNMKNPTQVTEVTIRTWYSPAISHWVKRNSVVRHGGHVFSNEMTVLTAFAHKQ